MTIIWGLQEIWLNLQYGHVSAAELLGLFDGHD